MTLHPTLERVLFWLMFASGCATFCGSLAVLAEWALNRVVRAFGAYGTVFQYIVHRKAFLTVWTKRPGLATLQELAHKIRTQDNDCTTEPIFVVQERYIDLGFDLEYSSEAVAWIDDEGTIVTKETDAGRFARFELGEFDEDTDGAQEQWSQTGYRERWDFVQPFLTRVAAEDFCERHKHKYRELRIDVDSGYRNPEWMLLRAALLQLLPEQPKGGSA